MGCDRQWLNLNAHRGGGGYKSSAAGSSSGGGAGGASSGNLDGDATIDGILEVGDVSWRVSAGWAHATYSLTNTSEDRLIWAPSVTIAARDENGSVVGTSGGIATVIFPGQTIWFEDAVTDAEDVSTIEVTPQSVEGWMTESASAQDASSLSVKDVNCKTKLGNALGVTGEVTCQKKSRFNQGQVGITVIFKDADGGVIGGQVGIVECPSDGSSTPFEINVLNAPDYATYEVYAYDD